VIAFRPDAHVLVIAAHPDDEVLGAGGLMAHRAGCSIAIASEGTSSETDTSLGAHMSHDHFLTAKRKATQEAAGILNAMVVREGEFPDQRMTLTRPLQEWIEDVVRETRPDVVLTHHPDELNEDHRVVARAVQVACRPYGSSGATVGALLAFHVDPLGLLPAPSRGATLLQPLSESELDRKRAALAVYHEAGALRDWPHPRSLQAIIAGARALGSSQGLHAAEAFTLLWGHLT
jgi:LmbE family N-acetylglucosaminyl deacetylase